MFVVSLVVFFMMMVMRLMTMVLLITMITMIAMMVIMFFDNDGCDFGDHGNDRDFKIQRRYGNENV